jgi:hypothetical protein
MLSLNPVACYPSATFMATQVACPYCTEAIAAASVICRYCRQNVGVALSLLRRVAELEQLIEVAQVESLPGEPLNDAHAIPDVSLAPAIPKRRHFALLGVANIAAYATFLTWISVNAESLPKSVGVALLFFPFASGALFGFIYSGVFFRKQLLVSAVTVGISIGPFLTRDLMNGLFRFPQDLALTAVALIIPGLISSAGSVTGRWIRSLRRGGVRQGRAIKLADRLLRTPNASVSRAKFVPALAALIGAIAPVLTFVASLVGAYLTYLAAVAGKR